MNNVRHFSESRSGSTGPVRDGSASSYPALPALQLPGSARYKPVMTGPDRAYGDGKGVTTAEYAWG